VKLFINLIRFTYNAIINYSQYTLSDLAFYSQKLIGDIMTTYTANCTRDLHTNTDRVSHTFNQFVTEWLCTMKLKAKIASERRQLSVLSVQVNCRLT
jgi:hypothetical protein